MLTRYASVQTAGLQGAADERQDRSSAAVLCADTSSMTLNAIRGLTPRQREVLTVMMQGKSNKGICRILNLAEPTVKNHVTAILKALEVTSRTEAVIKVARATAFATPYRNPPNSYLGYVPLAAPMTFR
jgi:DNA-binding NarL/FixJ family response regulator